MALRPLSLPCQHCSSASALLILPQSGHACNGPINCCKWSICLPHLFLLLSGIQLEHRRSRFISQQRILPIPVIGHLGRNLPPLKSRDVLPFYFTGVQTSASRTDFTPARIVVSTCVVYSCFAESEVGTRTLWLSYFLHILKRVCVFKMANHYISPNGRKAIRDLAFWRGEITAALKKLLYLGMYRFEHWLEGEHSLPIIASIHSRDIPALTLGLLPPSFSISACLGCLSLWSNQLALSVYTQENKQKMIPLSFFILTTQKVGWGWALNLSPLPYGVSAFLGSLPLRNLILNPSLMLGVWDFQGRIRGCYMCVFNPFPTHPFVLQMILYLGVTINW